MPEKDSYQISLKVILRNSLNEILILKAPNTGNFADYYDLPGGRINDNEFDVNLLEIIKREIAEELGNVDVVVFDKPVALGRTLSLKLDANGKRIRVLYIIFEAEYKGGDIIISEEHTGYKWVNLEKIKLEDYFVSAVLDGLKMYLN